MEKQLSALDKEMSTLNKIGKVLGGVRPGDVIATATLSPEARQVYSYLLSGLEQGNKEVQKSARAAALVAARMTDRLVSFHREAGEAGYTAMDALPELLTNAGQETQEKEAAQRFAQAVESQKEAVRRQYEGTEMWMKAPNGQPTNLTEDQWLAVRTPAFKAWFGDWEAEYRKQENIERGTRAVDEVLRTRQDVPKAMFRSETGGIDFVYGKEGAPSKKYAGGYGIAHILAKHGQAAVDMIPTVIAKGKATQKHNDRIRFNYAGYTAVVRLDFDGNQKTWLVTNFEKYANKKDSLTAEVFARSADDPDGAHSTVGGNLSLGFTIPQEEANSQAVSKVVDENGEPLVVYHGSDAQFDVFDKTKGRANMDIQGMFFSPWEIDAQGYGGHVRAFFLNIKNPANEGQGYKALNRYVGQNYAGIKAREDLASHGYDGVNNGDEEFIAFDPTQIKSVDNNGNFSADDPNIYHQASNGSKNNFAARQEKGGDRENRDNEISQEVFRTYLNDGIMRSVEKTVADEIGQYTNLDAMADPVAKDKARDELPYIHKMLADFNLTVVQKNKKYKDRLAAKIEYARRCFDNDERIQSRIVRQMDGNEGQGDVYSTGREVVPGRDDTSGVGEASRRSARRVSNQVSGEKRGAREHFEKLYNEMAQKHSENQGAFSHGLHQAIRQEVKGDYNQAEAIIRLFEGADTSTFMHEMSHHYLSELKKLSERFPQSEAAKDYATIMEWATWQDGQVETYAGTASAKEFRERDKAIREAEKNGKEAEVKRLKETWAQERFARAFEEYLHSGAAPTSTLKQIFRRFKRWLTQIYQDVTGAGVRATSKVEAVMAQMVAFFGMETSPFFAVCFYGTGGIKAYRRNGSRRIEL